MKHIQQVALSGGITWGLVMFVTTLISLNTGYAQDFLMMMAGIYPGYSISVTGSLTGLVYGFLDVYIGVYLFSWVYGWFGKK